MMFPFVFLALIVATHASGKCPTIFISRSKVSYLSNMSCIAFRITSPSKGRQPLTFVLKKKKTKTKYNNSIQENVIHVLSLNYPSSDCNYNKRRLKFSLSSDKNESKLLHGYSFMIYKWQNYERAGLLIFTAMQIKINDK